MKVRIHTSTTLITSSILAIGVFVFGVFFLVSGMGRTAHADIKNGRLITVHDRGTESSFITDKPTLRQAFTEMNIAVDAHDAVEPGLDETLVAQDYQVNIYRARPVTVIDGATREKIVTPYQSAERIVKDVGISLYPEDTTTLTRSDDIVGDGAGLQLKITRATPITVDLYGTITPLRTQAKTVGDFLKEKKIQLGNDDRMSVSSDAPLGSNATFRIWREGKQTITVEEPVAFETQQIQDADQRVGYKVVQTPGKDGKRSVTYEIEIQNGKEVARTQITSITLEEPVKQVEIIGAKTDGGLTKAKGVNMFVDSNGVTHRETYYDLNMSVVMGYCGGGAYTVRADGVKVDGAGYILIAASLARYPRCSVVETSLGPAKVYDTGGFVSTYPDGYDIATDWSNYDGR